MDDLRADFVARIVRNSRAAADGVSKMAKDGRVDTLTRPLSDGVWLAVLMEFVWFYIHLVLRQAADSFGQEALSALMWDLARHAAGTVLTASQDAIPVSQTVRDDVVRDYSELLPCRMRTYSECEDCFPVPGGGAAGTLFNEFGKVIAELSGFPNDAVLVLTAVSAVAQAPVDVDIPGFLTAEYLATGTRGLCPDRAKHTLGKDTTTRTGALCRMRWYLFIRGEIAETMERLDSRGTIDPEWIADWGSRYGLEPHEYGATWIIMDEDARALTVAACGGGRILVATAFIDEEGRASLAYDADDDGEMLLFPPDGRAWPEAVRFPKWCL